MIHVTLHAKVMPSTIDTGKPLVILHGLFGMGDNWGSHARHWASKGMHVHLLDMRNHGRSAHVPIHTYEAMSEDVRQYLLTHFPQQSVTLLGHSMGGKVAMHLACHHPELVEKLLVADIGPKAYPPHHKEVIEAMHALDLSSIQSRMEADRAMEKHLPSRSLRQFLLKNLTWKQDKQLGWKFNLPILSSQIQRIGTALDPIAIYHGATLFVRGLASGYILDEDIPDILTHFPLAQLESIEGAGHWLHAEKPEAFREAVESFICD
ncbi:MAG: alpha/beta fold hydrolase [Schleiferiaceae bacterium]|nr:alpha/beta fold hydrolase [Flavobacteriales bacterium]MDG1005835.1 alpha/beta fold hydrolase [Schleiferiaceae bacterium]MDG1220966.1 alpha/beta fold hydrolase [Schleiferiaceae bacterium]MDG2225895.1 alpha/beta fold hydrolase [Schleiferiaceae bacterium]MDO7602040.1 alpha/beta fold hydrolase [Schleiferiaceae bacterium]